MIHDFHIIIGNLQKKVLIEIESSQKDRASYMKERETIKKESDLIKLHILKINRNNRRQILDKWFETHELTDVETFDQREQLAQMLKIDHEFLNRLIVNYAIKKKRRAKNGNLKKDLYTLTLNKLYFENPDKNPDREQIKQISERFNKPEKTINVWFRQKRFSEKKKLKFIEDLNDLGLDGSNLSYYYISKLQKFHKL